MKDLVANLLLGVVLPWMCFQSVWTGVGFMVVLVGLMGWMVVEAVNSYGGAL